MRVSTAEQVIDDIRSFYNDFRLDTLDINTYVRIWDYSGKHLSSSYFTSLRLSGRNLIVMRGEYINHEKKIGHQFNTEWTRKFHVSDVGKIYVKYLYGNEYIEKYYE